MYFVYNVSLFVCFFSYTIIFFINLSPKNDSYYSMGFLYDVWFGTLSEENPSDGFTHYVLDEQSADVRLPHRGKFLHRVFPDLI